MYRFAASFKYRISNIRNKIVASSVGGCIHSAPTTSHIASTLSILLLVPSNKPLDMVQQLSVATCLLVLLNLSSAFDTVDHAILPQCPEHFLGLTGTVFIWLSTYIRGKSSSVAIANFESDEISHKYGVLQGSILVFRLFNLFMLPLCQLLWSYSLEFLTIQNTIC